MAKRTQYGTIAMTAAIAALSALAVPQAAIAEEDTPIVVDTTKSDSLRERMKKVNEDFERLWAAAEHASEMANGARVRLQRAQEEAETLRDESRTLTRELTQAQDELSQALRNDYKLGPADLVAHVVGSENLSQAVTAEYISQKQIDHIRELTNKTRETRDAMDEARKELETKKAVVTDAQADAERCLASLDDAVQKLDDYRNSLDQELQDALAQEEEERRRQEADRARAAVRRALDAADATALDEAVEQLRKSGGDITVDGTVAEIVVTAAYSQLGVPYVWGGEEPGGGLDCSGLVQYCYRQAGIELYHYSEEQSAFCDKPASAAVPGDIVWTPGHVGIAIGDGRTIEAVWAGVSFGTTDSFVSSGSPVGKV